MRFVNAIIATVGLFVALFGVFGLLVIGIFGYTGKITAVLILIAGIAIIWWANHRDEMWNHTFFIKQHHNRRPTNHKHHHHRHHKHRRH